VLPCKGWSRERSRVGAGGRQNLAAVIG
jgi:hypothetical protein